MHKHTHTHVHKKTHAITLAHTLTLTQTDSLRSALSFEVAVGGRSLRLLCSFRCALSYCCSHASLPLSFVLLLIGNMPILAWHFGKCVCAQSANTFRSVRWSYCFHFLNSRLFLCFVLSLSLSFSFSLSRLGCTCSGPSPTGQSLPSFGAIVLVGSFAAAIRHARGLGRRQVRLLRCGYVSGVRLFHSPTVR